VHGDPLGLGGDPVLENARRVDPGAGGVVEEFDEESAAVLVGQRLERCRSERAFPVRRVEQSPEGSPGA